MKALNRSKEIRARGIPAGFVLASGIFADNALSSAIHNPVMAWVFPVLCGLVVGSLTVLTYVRHSLAYTSGAALFSALTVIALTLTLPRVEHIALLVLCALTAIVCTVMLRGMSSTHISVPVPVHVKMRDKRR